MQCNFAACVRRILDLVRHYFNRTCSNITNDNAQKQHSSTQTKWANPVFFDARNDAAGFASECHDQCLLPVFHTSQASHLHRK